MFNRDMQKTLLLVWPLLLGLGLIMMGNGLQGTLLGLRAQAEGFSVFATGIIMSLYYGGFLAGCLIVPHMIRSVGHIRVFAGLASLASTTILFHGIVVDEWVWAFIRFLSGVSFAGLFIVSESWLNNIAPNKLRGSVFSSYIFVLQGGMFAGQFLINFAPIDNITLFIIVSVLVSLSLMPVTLADKSPPTIEEPENIPFKQLVSISPLAVMGVCAAGVSGSVFLGLGPFYAKQIGMPLIDISLFMATYILGCALVPLLLGSLSDKMDRRTAIIGVAFLAFITALFVNAFPPALFVMTFLLGGFVTSFYSVSVAYMNDWLKPEQMVSASASLILMNGAGACVGPLIIGAIMEATGSTAFFFPFIAFVCLIVIVTGVFRAFSGHNAPTADDQSEFTPIPPRVGTMLVDIQEED